MRPFRLGEGIPASADICDATACPRCGCTELAVELPTREDDAFVRRPNLAGRATRGA